MLEAEAGPGGHLQEEGVPIHYLQDPVRAGDEARQAQRKHVVRCKLLHHLGGCGRLSRRRPCSGAEQAGLALMFCIIRSWGSTETASM